MYPLPGHKGAHGARGGALGSITMNKVSGGVGIPAELFHILTDDAVKMLHLVCQQIGPAPRPCGPPVILLGFCDTELSKFAGILSAALKQHHLLGFKIAQLEFHHLH